MAEIRPAKFADALTLADRLRFEDAREIASTWGVGAREGLFHCLMHSDRSFMVFEAGEPEALWGITGLTDGGLDIGVPWMLAGDGLFVRERARLARSRRAVEHLLLDYDVLTNVTDTANAVHLRWLEWCGFRELRRHDAYGAAGRPFVEFYRVNHRRKVSDRAVRAVLERRDPAAPVLPGDGVVSRLIATGIAVLNDRAAPPVAAIDELPAILEALAANAGLDARIRLGCARLMLEISVCVGGPVTGRGSIPDPLRDLLNTLTDVSDLMAIDGLDARLILAIDPARPSARVERPAVASANVRPVRGGIAGAFEWMIRTHVRALTADGRMRRGQGNRLWRVAVGATAESGRGTFRTLQTELQQLLTESRVVRALTAEQRPCSGTELLARPLDHGRVMTRLRRVPGAASAVAELVACEADRWAVAVDEASNAPGAPRQIRVLGDAVAVASAISDRVARRLLPSLRLGGVVSGFSDRQWMYRMLRAHLLIEAGVCTTDEMRMLLQDEVSALVLAGRLEDQLLRVETAAPSAEEIASLLHETLAWWAPDGASDSDGASVVGLLLPVFAVPTAHAVQLPPAVAAWHLTAAGRLAGTVRAMGDVAGDDGTGSRRRYRNFLRKLARDIDTVAMSRDLGMTVDGERARGSSRSADER